MGNVTQIADIEYAMMSSAISAHQTRAVKAKRDMKTLKRHIMNQLILGALEKSGINGTDRFHPSFGKRSGKRHRMLFGNAHVKKTVRKLLRKLRESGSRRHGGRNSDHPFVFARQFTNR